MEIFIIAVVLQTLNALFFIYSRRVMVCEILALRQQLAIFKRKHHRPSLRNRDRLFWVLLSRVWSGWKSALMIVQPETVLRWQKKRFRDFWRRKSSRKPGRPSIPQEHIDFIRRISGDHPEYGEDRIALELELKFGIKHSTATIRKYMVKNPNGGPPSQSWRTFLTNQAGAIWMCDFCTQYTVTFTVLHIFVIMELESRKIVHFNVTAHPTLDWTQQQFRNALFEEEEPKFVIHDNDGKFGQFGKPARASVNGKRVSCRSSLDSWLSKVMKIRGIPTPYGAPNANAHIERFIGTLRREFLDLVLIWNENQLRRLLAEYIRWYNTGRVHQGIHGIPDANPALTGDFPENGRLVAKPILNGLHHDYRLVA